jgi:HSP20 family protein
MLAPRLFEGRPLAQLRTEMDRLFQQFFGEEHGFPFQYQSAFPAVNMWEDADRLYLEAELPGVLESDLEITVCGDELTIKGQRAAVQAKKGTTTHRRERSDGTFGRIIRLPALVADKGIEAALHNGILTITLPKAEEARSRKIQVKALA